MQKFMVLGLYSGAWFFQGQLLWGRAKARRKVAEEKTGAFLLTATQRSAGLLVNQRKRALP